MRITGGASPSKSGLSHLQKRSFANHNHQPDRNPSQKIVEKNGQVIFAIVYLVQRTAEQGPI